MSFLQQIREELTRYSSGGAYPEVPNLLPLFTELLELGAATTASTHAAGWVDSEHRDWVESGRLSALALELARQVAEHWPKSTPADQAWRVQWAARDVLQRSLAIDGDPHPQIAEALAPILRKIGRVAHQNVIRAATSAHVSQNPFDYACELGLVSAPIGVTALGRTFLQLRGLDCVRWILALELTRSAGSHDEWRCGFEVATWLLSNPRERWDCLADESGPWFASETLWRLDGLGIVTADEVQGTSEWGYDLTPLGREILTELTAPTPPPMLVLARSLSADVTAQALRSTATPAGLEASAATVEEAVSSHARNLGHELRNKLPPLQMAIETIGQALPVTARTAATSKAFAMSERAIKELFEFADQTTSLAAGLQRPAEWFEVTAALRDAITSGRNGNMDAQIELIAANGLKVRGQRMSLVYAVANLVRNAIQATAGRPAHVDVVARATGQHLTIDVADNGPGVDPEFRHRIFEAGFTTRGGGSGQGLHLARTTIQRDFGGTVDCIDKHTPGALFRILIPGVTTKAAKVAAQGRGEPT